MRFDLRLVLPVVLFFACTSPTTVQTPSMIPTDAPTALASATPSTQSSSAPASALPISNPATVLSAVHFADAAHGRLGLEEGLLGTLMAARPGHASSCRSKSGASGPSTQRTPGRSPRTTTSI